MALQTLPNFRGALFGPVEPFQFTTAVGNVTLDAAGESTAIVGYINLSTGPGTSKTISAAGSGKIHWMAGSTLTFNNAKPPGVGHNPNRPFSVAVLAEWQRWQRLWRFSGSSDPPSSRLMMWSVCSGFSVDPGYLSPCLVHWLCSGCRRLSARIPHMGCSAFHRALRWSQAVP